MTWDEIVNGIAGAVGGALGWLLGGLDGGVKILVVFMVIDQVTGLMKAWTLKTWSSDVGFHGIFKKVCMFALVGIANIIGRELLGNSEVLRDAVVFFYIANEGISIIENAIEIGIPIPETLREKFQTWYNKEHEAAQESHNEESDSSL